MLNGKKIILSALTTVLLLSSTNVLASPISKEANSGQKALIGRINHSNAIGSWTGYTKFEILSPSAICNFGVVQKPASNNKPEISTSWYFKNTVTNTQVLSGTVVGAYTSNAKYTDRKTLNKGKYQVVVKNNKSALDSSSHGFAYQN